MDIEEIYNEYKIDINDIVDSLRNNALSFFCGSGATADATGTTWENLFKKELQVIDKKETDYYRLAQYYELHFGRAKLVNSITNNFSEKKHSKHIRTLLKLPVFEYWTTNYDTIIEDLIYENTGVTPSVIYNSKNIIKINENKKYKVFKMNGSISDSSSMIITSEDYNEYKLKQSILIEFLKRELILNTFVFIGYSFKDNLIMDCLNEIKKCFPNLNHYHYRIDVKDKEHYVYQKIEQKYFEETYKIKTIFVDNFAQIDKLIELIYQQYKSRNIFISGSFRFLETEEENYANLLCKSIVDILLENDYNIYSGDGKRLGSYVISNATKKLMNKNMNYIHNKLTIMPYIDHTFKHKKGNDKERIMLVDKMLKDCSISIFLYGQSENGEWSQGVYTEYLESKKHSLITIPIPTTGYAAKKIYEDMLAKGKPWYLEKYHEKLETEKNTDSIAILILEIINMINNR